MVWFLFVLLSCIAGDDLSYRVYPIDRKMEAFAIGEPYQKSSWLVRPSLRICADTKVTTLRVSHAVRYWEKLGYKFGGITTDHSPLCMNARFGEILITLPESGFGGAHIASTKIYTKIDNNTIIKAKIFIMPKHSKKERVIEHEIGHALGWSHYNQKFHMMHPNWFMGGYNSKGLRK